MAHRIALLALASTLISCQVLPEIAPMLVDATLSGLSRRKCPDVSARAAFNKPMLIKNQNKLSVTNTSIIVSKLKLPAPTPVCPPTGCMIAIEGIYTSNLPPQPPPEPAPPAADPIPPPADPTPPPPADPPSTQTGSNDEDDDPSWYCDFLTRDVDACTSVTDEYDELLVSDRLVRPQAYVDTVRGGMSDRAFTELQPTGFRLSPERDGRGIAIFRTNENSIGKFLYRWKEAPGSGGMSIEIENAVVYREGEGDKPLGPMPSASLLPSQAVDLDPPKDDDTVPVGPDLFAWKGQDGTHYVQAAPGVVIDFPTRSFCGNQ